MPCAFGAVNTSGFESIPAIRQCVGPGGRCAGAAALAKPQDPRPIDNSIDSSIRCDPWRRPMMIDGDVLPGTEFQPHTSHWGVFSARMRDGRVEVRPYAKDPDPNRLIE